MAAKIHERLESVKTHNPKIDRKADMEMIVAVEKAKRKVSFDFASNPQQGEQLRKSIMGAIVDERVKAGTYNPEPAADHIGRYFHELEDMLGSRSKVTDVFPCMNEEYIMNQQFYQDVKPIQPPLRWNNNPKRVGLLGFKVGMTSTFDMWGYHIPMTVIQFDRCQIVGHFETEDPNIVSVQVGGGMKSLRRITKSQIGPFLKKGLIPSIYLREFKVTRENVLPVGFRLGPRHFTPGQFVDVRAVATDKGFQGAMKRWGFGGQPASHGVSVSHRSLGSTGQHQNPGRVFKGKKMHGHMGGHTRVQHCLKVYRVDFDRSLVYLLGSVPGKPGDLVEIKDSFIKDKQNYELLNFPTFLPEPDKVYASITQVEPPLQDPSEAWLHDNVLPKEDEAEEAASTAGALDADVEE